MPDLHVHLASLLDVAVSVHELLVSLRRHLRLRPLLIRTLAEKAVRQAAIAAGLSVSTEELQQAVNRYRQQRGLRTKEDTHRWLEQNGLHVLDLEAIVEQTLLAEKFREHLARTQLEERFNAEQDRYARVRVSSFAVPAEGLARELLQRVQDEGASFDELARQHTPPTSTAVSQAVVMRAELPVSVADLILQAKPDSVAGPVASQHGWHLFHVHEFLPPQLDPPTVAWIRQRLFDDWLRDRLANVRLDLTLLDQP